MKKILSGLLLSTATLGGVVSIVAQATNSKVDTRPETKPVVSLGQVNATPFALDQSPLEIVETSTPVTHKNTLTNLLSEAQSVAPLTTEEEETVDYEKLQNLRTGINKEQLSPEVTLTVSKVDELTAQKFQETVKDLKVTAVSKENEAPATEVTLLGEADKKAEEAPTPVVTNEIGNQVTAPVVAVDANVNPAAQQAVSHVPATQTLSQSDAEANRVAAEQAAAAQAEADRVAAEQAAAAQAEADRVAAEQAAAAQAEANRVAAEQAAAAQAEADRVAAEQAAAAQAEADRVATEQAAAAQAEANRIAAEQAAAAQAEANRVAAEQAAAAQAEANRVAAEQAAAAQQARVQAVPVSNTSSNNTYPIGQCTWGVKELAPWVGNYWGNASNWVNSAQAAGFTVGTNPVPGAIAVWPKDAGSYGHVALVTAVESSTSIQVMESNYAGNQKVGNYRGSFDPTAKIWGGEVYYIYPNA